MMRHLWTLISRFGRRHAYLLPALALAGLLQPLNDLIRWTNPNLTLTGWLSPVAVLATKPSLSQQKKVYQTRSEALPRSEKWTLSIQNLWQRGLLSQICLRFVLAFSALLWLSSGWLWPASTTQASPLLQSEIAGVVVEVIGPPTVTVGDTFEIQVVLHNSLPSGLFGYQLRLNWDAAIISPVEGLPQLNPEFPLIAQTDLAPGQFEVTASRQGDVPDLTGPLTLLTWTFQATAPTNPGTSYFNLTAVTLGQKDGTTLGVDGISNLTLTVLEPARQQGHLLGNVQVESHGPGNQGGITVRINELNLATNTAATGDFSLTEVEFGTYTLRASQPGFLSATCTNVAHNQQATTLAGVTLLAGDLTGDEVIDVADATALGLALGSDSPGSGVDLNADGEANVLDLILLGVNFGASAADHPWACQP